MPVRNSFGSAFAGNGPRQTNRLEGSTKAEAPRPVHRVAERDKPPVSLRMEPQAYALLPDPKDAAALAVLVLRAKQSASSGEDRQRAGSAVFGGAAYGRVRYRRRR